MTTATLFLELLRSELCGCASLPLRPLVLLLLALGEPLCCDLIELLRCEVALPSPPLSSRIGATLLLLLSLRLRLGTGLLLVLEGGVVAGVVVLLLLAAGRVGDDGEDTDAFLKALTCC